MELRISDQLHSIINYSREEAMRTGCYGIAPDHLLLGILDTGKIRQLTPLWERAPT